MRLALGLTLSLLVGCSAGRTTDDHSTTDGGFVLDTATSDGSGAACVNLECRQLACDAGHATTLSGTVWNPGKSDPLYNAIVYVPNSPVEPFKPGVTCEKCGSVSGSPVAAAISGADGSFRLENAPVGTDVPLVIQIGRWRRQVTIPKVDACVDNPLPADLTRLPKNQKEGDIPLTAIVTSYHDPTECILRKIGIDDGEFTVMGKGGRVHLFRFGDYPQFSGQNLGPATPTGNELWGSLDVLKTYDLVAFPCGSVTANQADKQRVIDYANAGGRVFATDLSHPWLSGSAPAPWNTTASWGSASIANPFKVDTSFPKGKALADWLKGIGATPNYGELELTGTYSRSTAVTPPTQQWITNTSTVQHFTFNTPVGAAEAAQCGRVVYSSFHIASGGSSSLPNGGKTFPAACSVDPLTAQEKVLEFMLFDLASCVQKDTDAPTAPPIR